MKDERPVDVIRRMNPGKDIPTGAELAERLKKKQLNEIPDSPSNQEILNEIPIHENIPLDIEGDKESAKTPGILLE